MNNTYKDAGVNIDNADKLLLQIKEDIKNTHIPGVLGEIGFFGGLFELNKKSFKDPVLVSSIDGVGTKLKIAFESKQYKSIGHDIVNHCVNDIAVGGAIPLFFQDYYGTGVLDVEVASQVISGIAQACRENKCALIGGETAEMPGFYSKGEFDLVGSIVGVVEKDEIIDGSNISLGDVLIGVSSTGLHTNGFSLARKILFDKMKFKVSDKYPNTNESIADVLLSPHKSYLEAIQCVKKQYQLKGACHITGGGLFDNIPRILPANVDALINTNSWPSMNVFEELVKLGDVAKEEAYRVFNMGIGMVFIVRADESEKVISFLNGVNCQAYQIGEIVKGEKKAILD